MWAALDTRTTYALCTEVLGPHAVCSTKYIMELYRHMNSFCRHHYIDIMNSFCRHHYVDIMNSFCRHHYIDIMNSFCRHHYIDIMNSLCRHNS